MYASRVLMDVPAGGQKRRRRLYSSSESLSRRHLARCVVFILESFQGNFFRFLVASRCCRVANLRVTTTLFSLQHLR